MPTQEGGQLVGAWAAQDLWLAARTDAEGRENLANGLACINLSQETWVSAPQIVPMVSFLGAYVSQAGGGHCNLLGSTRYGFPI